MTDRVCSVILLCSAMFLCSCSLPGTGVQPEDASYTPAIRIYDDYDGMSRALGFDMLQISGGGYVPVRYAVIEDTIGEIIYTQEEAELNLRVSETTDDIAGVNGVVYRRTDMSGCEVQIGSYKNIQVAKFAIGDRYYAVSATGMTTKVFEDITAQIVEQLTAS